MHTQPNIIITSRDAARLETLLEGLPAGSFAGLKALEEELYRATLVDPEEIPATVVTMNSTVRFTVMPSGVEHRLKLVYPGKAAAPQAGRSGKLALADPWYRSFWRGAQHYAVS